MYVLLNMVIFQCQQILQATHTAEAAEITSGKSLEKNNSKYLVKL